MKWTPFTAHISVTPAEGKRFVYVRALQKLASEAYTALVANADINIAMPGGGQHTTVTGYEQAAMSQMTYGTAIKPQFGDYPAQLMITGFYKNTNSNAQVYAETDIISANQNNYGSTATPQVSMPSTNVNDEVKALKAIINTAIANPNLPSSANAKLFRLDYNGVIYGDRGFHFPR